MTKKHEIIRIDGGFVVVDHRKTTRNDLGLWKICHHGTLQKIDEIHIKCFSPDGLLCTNVVIASIGVKIEGVPLIEEVNEAWLFSAFKSEENYEKNIPYFSHIFYDHTEMKVFSAKHSAKDKARYPNYCSMYWTIEDSTKQYSEEDITEAIEIGMRAKQEDTLGSRIEYFHEWKQRKSLQKVPISVELEYLDTPSNSEELYDSVNSFYLTAEYNDLRINAENNTITPIKINYES